MSFENIGGVGHSELKAVDCDFTADNFDYLDTLLFNIDQPAKIFIANDLDLTGHRMVKLPAGVELHSPGCMAVNDKLVKLKTNQYANCFMFVTDGENIVINGLHIKGPNPHILDQNYTYGQSAFLKVMHGGVTVKNCFIEVCDTQAIQLHYAPTANIIENVFKNNRRDGFGYSIWQGGSGKGGCVAYIARNKFYNTRHAIGSSGHLNDWTAEYNYFGGCSLQGNLDRHNYDVEGYGGGNVTIRNNVFDNYGQHFQLQVPTLGKVKIHDNWFRQPQEKIGTIADQPAHLCADPNIEIGFNYYGWGNFYTPFPFADIPVKNNFITHSDTLTFRYKRCYTYGYTGQYLLQVIDDSNTVRYTRELTGGGHGWRYVQVTIPADFKPSIRVIHKYISLEERPLAIYIDNIKFRGQQIVFADGNTGNWAARYGDKLDFDQIGGGVKPHDAYIGKQSWQFNFGRGKKFRAGQYAELYYK